MGRSVDTKTQAVFWKEIQKAMTLKQTQKKDICAICGGQLTETSITHEERRGTHLYLFQHVPALVCSVCGEIWIEETTLKEIDRLLQSGEPTHTVETPVYDFALAGQR
jgi:YgiT-type zinc finger domain-containing protein